MYKRILVAVDGSPHADVALRHAVELARDCQAELTVLHVQDTTWMLAGSEFALDTTQINEARRQVGEGILDRARQLAQTAGVQARLQLVQTDTPARSVADVIAGEAAAWPADLVVVGTHGHRGLRHLLLGSVAEGVARISAMPVLFVR
ncbi:MAG TPA: universal stress protein [Thiobacillaceae bacterium]|nr:universal stress protein [Thiobacillaceae bacterium]HNU65283.1 universal stress protein [Thiobacillaceae bacterium]